MTTDTNTTGEYLPTSEVPCRLCGGDTIPPTPGRPEELGHYCEACGTTTGNAPGTLRVTVNLTLTELGEFATFHAYLRAEPIDAAAEGFGIEGAVRILRSIGREEWEALGSPVVLPITVRNVSAESVTDA